MQSQDAVLVIGGGIAGNLLAWRLAQRGVAVQLIDDVRPGRASWAAAGLLNPITGRRLALADRASRLLPEAIRFYREMEVAQGRSLWHPLPIEREFLSQAEWQQWLEREKQPGFADFVRAVRKPGRDDFGGISIEGGGWVDYTGLLSSVPASQATWHPDQWEPDAWRATVFTQGYAPDTLERPELRWNPAAGDILTVRLPGWDERAIRVRDYFTIPLGDGLFRVGATYDREDLHPFPQAYRATFLLEAIRAWTGLEPELVEHRVGIRPILRRRRPLIGPLPGMPGSYICNGLGSKGGLWAPWAANHLAAVILDGAEPDAELAPPRRAERVRLTDLAHAMVAPWLQEGDRAIDATAGNGHDTVFLAERVGESGAVWAFDLQTEAVARTQRRLEDHGLAGRVTLVADSHGQVDRLLSDDAHAIRAVMMNLGYLPGGHRDCVTHSESTLAFLHRVLPRMAPDAVISVLAYRGHAGGVEEHAAVREWMRGRENEGWSFESRCGEAALSPELFVLKREALSSAAGRNSESASTVAKDHWPDSGSADS